METFIQENAGLVRIVGIAVVVIAALMTAAFITGVILAAQRRRKLLDEAADQERAFETEIRSQLEAVPFMAAAPQPSAPQPPPLPASASPVPPPPPALPAGPAQTGVAVGPEEVARRLFALRLITDREGSIPLPIPPNGLIYRLKKGGSVAILPRMESQEVMAHLTQRFEMVIAELPNGELLVLERLQQRLPSLMDDLPGFEKKQR